MAGHPDLQKAFLGFLIDKRKDIELHVDNN